MKQALTSFLVIALIMSTLIGLAQANPYLYDESGPPPPGVSPLVISISSPKNNTLIATNNITFTFSIQNNDANAQFPSRDSFTVPSIHTLEDCHLKADWLENNVTVYNAHMNNSEFPPFPIFWSYNQTFWDVPDGEHSVVVTALGEGGYAEGPITWYSFQIATISVINFTVDATHPGVSILSPQNTTYFSSEIPFNFNTIEEPSLISYSLDGQKNLTLSGKTTLTDLHIGEHRLIVYARDAAGNVGVFETKFTIEPFPTAIVALSLAGVIVIIAVALLLFRRRRRVSKHTAK